MPIKAPTESRACRRSGAALLGLTLALFTGCSSAPEDVRRPGPRTAIEAGFATVPILTVQNFDDFFETFDDIHPVREIEHPGGTTEVIVGDGFFSGCPDVPEGPASGKPWCLEPFHDRNGNGWFDAAWIAGFGSSRPAVGVLDPIVAAAWAVRAGGRLIGFATIDAVGYHYSEVQQIRAMLAERGLVFDLLIVSATHTHEAPDTMGQWGPGLSGDLELPAGSGAQPRYLAQIRARTVEALVTAVDALEPAELCIATASSEINPVFASMPPEISPYTVYRMGGASFDYPQAPDGIAFQIEGLENDWRDPMIINHTLPILQFRRDDGSVLGTVMNIHSHPESLWARNTKVSSDYPHWVRVGLEAAFPGSLGIHVSGSVGGIIGPHDVPVWLRDEAGVRQWGPMIDPDSGTPFLRAGEPVTGPLIAANGTEAKARSLGWAYADLGVAALDDATCHRSARVDTADREFDMPVHNPQFVLAGLLGLFPRPFYDARGDELESVTWQAVQGLGQYPSEPLGFARTRVGAAKLRFSPGEELLLVSAPGEMFSEHILGLPDDLFDPAQVHRWWPQGREKHARDYRVAFTLPELFWKANNPVRQRHWFLFGLGNDELGYLVPESDFIRYHPLLDDQPADHYEESNSPGPAAERVLHGVYLELAGELETSGQN